MTTLGRVQRDFPILPRLVSLWQEGEMVAEGKEFGSLQDLLREHHAAREYFCEAMQIDAELRQRMGPKPKVARALTSSDGGDMRPVAGILVSGLRFADEDAFRIVYARIEENEPLAQLWLRLYPALCACSGVCFAGAGEAAAAVRDTCSDVEKQLSAVAEVATTGEFRDTVVAAMADRFANRSLLGSSRRTRSVRAIVQVLMNAAADYDPTALCRSVDAIIPRQIPVDRLRQLSMRYLLGMPNARIASDTGVSARSVRQLLDEARIAIWLRCVGHSTHFTDVEQTKRLGELLSFIDGFAPSAGSAKAGATREHEWDAKLRWLGANPAAAENLLSLAMIDHFLYENLTLTRLLEESKHRKETQYHTIVTDMIGGLERAAKAQARPATSPIRGRGWRSLARVASVVGAAAAVLLVAVALLPERVPDQELVHSEKVEIDEGLDRRSDQANTSPVKEPEGATPVQRELAATVVRVLGTTNEGELAAGAELFVGETFDIRDQVVELTTVAGATLVLEGPVTARIDALGEVFLQDGKLAAVNDVADTKLVVRTPSAVVVDVGTEFGVRATNEGQTSVAVYDGAVEVAPGSQGDNLEQFAKVVVRENKQLVTPISGRSTPQPTPLVHERDFIRPDELALRIEEQEGSLEAAEQVAFIDLLRVEGLLAFQSFHARSDGAAFSIGFKEPPIRPGGAARFGPSLRGGGSVLKSSGSLAVANGDSLFLDIDTSDASPAFQGGLVDERGMLGKKPGELWFHWVATTGVSLGSAPDWIGVSVMRNDQRDVDEPLFVGRPHLFETFGSQAYGNAENRQQLDFAPRTPGVQSKAVDGATHRWVVRFQCRGAGNATASIWCDVEPSRIVGQPPHSRHEYQSLEFDRLRFEASAGGDRGTFYFDEVVITKSPKALADVLAIASSGAR